MVIFAIVMLIVHRHQPISVVTQQRRTARRLRLVLRGDVHEPVRDLRLRHRLDPRRGDERPEAQGAPSRARLGGRCLRHRRHLPAGDPDGDPEPGTRRSRRAGDRPRSSTPTSRSSGRPSTCSSSRPPSSSAACASWRRPCACASAWPGTTGCRSRAASARSTHSCTRRSGPASRSRSSRPSRCSSTPAPAYVAIAATGMIYLAYFLGNLASHEGEAGRMAEGESAVQARSLGPDRQRARPRLRRRSMLVNFAWPRAASNPTPNQTAGVVEPRPSLPQQDPDPLHGAGVHLDHRDHLLRALRDPKAISRFTCRPSPGRSRSRRSPCRPRSSSRPSSAASQEGLLSARAGRSSRRPRGCGRPGTGPWRTRPGLPSRVEGDPLDEQQRRAAADAEQLGGVAVGPDGLERLDGPARVGRRSASARSS